MAEKVRRTGTLEWSTKSLNCQIGCQHNCLCYARANALRRKLIRTPEEWKTPRPKKTRDRPMKLAEGDRIMSPTTHDVTPENVSTFIELLKPWLGLGNEILIVSKPHLPVIQQICNELECYKNRITFRFSIGSADQSILDFWEKDAPTFVERFNCLKFTFNGGWQNSVSGEPFLDDAVDVMVRKVEPFVNGAIWIGKLNKSDERVLTTGWSRDDYKLLDKVKAAQTDGEIKKIYTMFKDNPKIKWKDSIKEVIGLPPEEIG